LKRAAAQPLDSKESLRVRPGDCRKPSFEFQEDGHFGRCLALRIDDLPLQQAASTEGYVGHCWHVAELLHGRQWRSLGSRHDGRHRQAQSGYSRYGTLENLAPSHRSVTRRFYCGLFF
jgi:hypothetical protein